MIWLSLAHAGLFGALLLAAIVSAQDGRPWRGLAINAGLSLAVCLWLLPAGVALLHARPALLAGGRLTP